MPTPITAIQTFLESADLTAARAAIEVAPSTGIAPSAITNTAMTLSGTQTITGDKTWTGVHDFQDPVDFISDVLFHAGVSLVSPVASEGLRVGIGFAQYADLTAANAVLNAGDIYYDLALGKYRSATA